MSQTRRPVDISRYAELLLVFTWRLYSFSSHFLRCCRPRS